jgi:ABC-2 type transport system ATP-binding protein
MSEQGRSGSSAIAVCSLSKHYGRVTALRELSFEVAPGEVFGFLGLNGAGKSTTIRILLDLVHPSSGAASIFGLDCQRQGRRVRGDIGYLPGELHLYGDLTGHQVLELTARLRGGPVRDRYSMEMQSRLELTEAVLKRKLRDYSTGMKRKLGLLQALQRDPALLILDEPTEGLDPLTQDSFYRILADLKQRGRTVFMSSHVLPEVERVCSRFALIRAGSLVLTSSVDELRAAAPRVVRVHFAKDVREGPAGLPAQYRVLALDSRSWLLSVTGPLGALIERLGALPVEDLEVAEPRLEDVIMRYYREGA